MKADLELVSIKTETYPLDGLFYTPRGRTARGAVMIFHGNCHNFYMGPSRFLPEPLIEQGYACLAFNRRGHDMVTSLDGRNIGGGSFQLAHEAIADGRHAAAFLAARGFPNPIVIGHSNGGVLAAQHVADHPDTPALVLMSAHLGGAGITTAISAKGLFGRDRLPELIGEAERMIAQGRGKELMLLPGWWWVISAESLVDYSRKMPATLDNARNMKSPVLYVCGDQEPPDLYPAQEFATRCSSRCDAAILPNCDHFYTGVERETAGLVVGWLQKTLGTA
jgi:pimeloyl-ACP methyl ester carboxylesterase